MARGPLGGCCGPASASHSDACTGCGELYVDPWINHPADCVDPCDTCGNFNGQSCGKCRPIFGGIRSLWGYRCGDDCEECVGPVCFNGRCGALNGGGGCGCDGGCSGGCDGGCDSGGCSCGSEVVGPSCGCEAACGCEPSCGFEPACGLETIHSGEVLYGDNGGQIINEGEYIVEGQPTPHRSVEIQPADQPYKPERSRKIFNPRPRVATGDGRSVGY
ncbi:hypothetical protein [Planctomycetes bacterium K23_9]|uniref:Uncharacterized protein n=1 Tax=Stieleria marina TaxID=1930275 RepID=A0A517NT76_9BACT|nr:hypothetical protein K239x_22860 [Planctomycetes bacterium K23_9]